MLAPGTSEAAARAWRFGYENESAKLHLAMLLEWDRKQPGAGRKALMSLADMDESTADAILDWVDADNVPRDYGRRIGLLRRARTRRCARATQCRRRWTNCCWFAA